MTDTTLNNWIAESFPAPRGMGFSGLAGLITGLMIAMAGGAANAAASDAISPLSCAVVDANTITCTAAGVTTKCSGDVTIDSKGVILCPPACDSLTASPASIAAGATSTLTANCGRAVTYAWTGSGCENINNTSSCNVKPSATTTYTVKGINPAGTSFAPASATVTVQSQPAPVCTLASSPAFVPGAFTLTANCPGATTYIWSANTSCGTVATSPFCTVTPSSSTTYSVQGANAAVAGIPASVVVTVTGSTTSPPGGGFSTAPPAPATTAPVCTLEAPAAFVLGSFNLTASCTPAAATYNWSANAPCGTGATSPFCAVTPSSSTTYSVTGVNAVGASNTPSVTVSVTPPTAPTCFLTANPGTIVAGNSTILTANCTPAASTYNWTPATGLVSATNTATLTTSLTTTPGPYTYTVVGVNAVGSSSPAQGSVTVTAPPRGCTLIVTPLSLGAKETASLTAVCTPAAASYAWTGGTCAGTTSATCLAKPDITTAYTVTGKEGTGTIIGQANATVTVAAPVCTLTATPASVAPGGTFTLTAKCTPEPKSYTWSASNGAGVGLGNVVSGSVTAPLAAGSYTYSVAGSNGSGPGNTASATVQVTTAPVTYCGTDANKLDSGILSNHEYLNPQLGIGYQTRMDRGQSASFQFTTGSVVGGTGSIVLEMSSLGDMIQKFAQISTSPCDFKNYKSIDDLITKPISWDGCATNDLVVVLRYVLQDTTSPQYIFGSCSLQTNKTYYLNVRNEAALYPSQRNIDTCQAGAACAFVFQIH